MMKIQKNIGPFHIDFGRFAGENWKLFELSVLDIYEIDWINYITIQVGKCMFSISER